MGMDAVFSLVIGLEYQPDQTINYEQKIPLAMFPLNKDESIDAWAVQEWMKKRGGLEQDKHMYDGSDNEFLDEDEEPTVFPEIPLWKMFLETYDQLPDLFGLVIDEHVLPEKMELAFREMLPKFDEPGYYVYPSMPLEDDTRHAAMLIKWRNKLSPEQQADFDQSHAKYDWAMKNKQAYLDGQVNYRHFFDRLDLYRDYARHVFKHAGITIPVEELKLMMVWYYR